MVFLFELYEKYTADLFTKEKTEKKTPKKSPVTDRNDKGTRANIRLTADIKNVSQQGTI
jgi:hypothetical protein